MSMKAPSRGARASATTIR